MAVAHDEPGARIPSKQRVVITRGPYLFCFFEPIHRFAKQIVGLEPTIGRILNQFGFGATLRKNPGVVGAIIFAANSRQQLFRLRVTDAVTFCKPIGQRQDEAPDERLPGELVLVVRELRPIRSRQPRDGEGELRLVS